MRLEIRNILNTKTLDLGKKAKHKTINKFN